MSQELPASQEPEIKLNPKGEPYSTQAAAQAAIRPNGLSINEWEAVPHKGGFALQRIAGSGLPFAPPPAPQAPAVPEEEVWWVMFAEKSSVNDTTDVPLAVNNDQLIVQRGKKVPLPQRFLEIADHALYPQYRQEPGKDRLVDAWVKKYPYTRFEKATWADFNKMRGEGTRMAKELTKDTVAV